MNKSNLNQNFITALDIGTSKIACLIAEVFEDKLDIKGYRLHRSNGVQNGQITNIDAVKESVARILDETEIMAGARGSVIVNAAVNSISSVNLASAIDIAGHPISDAEVNRLIRGCASHFNVEDHKVIHCIPTGYRIDNMEQVKEPRGMYGSTLGVQLHMISANQWHLKNLETVMSAIHVNDYETVVTPYASSLSCLTEYEKDLGTILIDLGAGTTSLCVFYNSQIVFTGVIPIGSFDITKSIAQHLTISLEQAEKLKIYEGSAFLTSDDKYELLNIPEIEGSDISYASINRSDLTNVIASSVEIIFEMVKSQLKEKGLYQLPASRVVLTGGGSGLQGIKELSSAILERNVIIRKPFNIEKIPQKISLGNYSTCCGLLQFALDNPRLLGKKSSFKLKNSKIFKWFLQNF